MKSIFTNNKLFSASTITAFICLTFNAIAMLFAYSEMEFASVIQFICAICVVCIYISYKKHSKNVMKGMMGAELMALMIYEIYGLNIVTGINKTFEIILSILAAFLFINHFLINAEHKPSSLTVMYNQGILILYVLTSIAWCVYFAAFETTTALAMISSIIETLGIISLVLDIICIESRLDAYRIDREAAGWTEEKGYPEGYVHEFEKQ